VSEGGRKGVLSAPGETVSVGAMLQWAVFNRDPSVEIAAYTCVPHEKMMKLTVALAKNGANNDVVAIISAAIDDLSMAIEQIAETSQ
jgi:DNA-directed RNA polymerase subunit L